MMKYLFGLGNPGKKYQTTRHNVGFLFIDHFVSCHQIPQLHLQKKVHSLVSKSESLLVVKPETYMNNSGQAVRAILDYYSAENISNFDENNLSDVFVVHDDLDIVLGKYKIQQGVGPKVHNGLHSIYQHVGSQQFWHVRVGIDARAGDRSIPGEKYVLSSFLEKERAILTAVFIKIEQELLSLLSVSS